MSERKEMKSLDHELFEEIVQFLVERLSVRARTAPESMFSAPRIQPDVVVTDVEAPTFSPASWMRHCFRTGFDTILEFKPKRADESALHQILLYRLFWMWRNPEARVLSALVIGESEEGELREMVDKALGLSVERLADGIYVIGGGKRLVETLVVSIRHLDGSVWENRALKLASPDVDERRRVAKELLKVLPRHHVLRVFLALAGVVMPDEDEAVIITPESVRAFVERYGIDRLVRDVGPEKVLEAVIKGLERGDISPEERERLGDILVKVIKSDPKLAGKLKRAIEAE